MIEGQLVSVAIGDAWGCGYEFAPREWIEAHPPERREHIAHPKYAIGAGRYSDDTQMSLAIAEAMIEEAQGAIWEPRMLARRFALAFKNDPRLGYAGGFYEFLKSVKDGDDFIKRIKPSSTKAGAAMRASPLGAWPDEFQVIERAGIQATLTHNTVEGIVSAQAAALSAHYFFWRKGSQADLGAYLNDVLGSMELDWTTAGADQGEITGEGLSCVGAAVGALSEARSIAQMCEGLIRRGGDVDTACAIACGAGAFCDQMDLDWPEALSSGLESGSYGRAHLESVEARLREWYPRPAAGL